MKMPFCAKTFCGLFLCFACVAFSSLQGTAQTMLDLHEVLGNAYVCPVPQSIQFLAEDELIVLAAPTIKCYDAVSDIEIVAISLEGRVLARRSWTSTDSGLVLRPERLVLPQAQGIEVLDKDLRTIQTLRIARRDQFSILNVTDTGILSIALNGRTYFYAGTPLRQVDPGTSKLIPGGSEIVSTLDGSWELARVGNTLVQQRAGAQPRTFADLDWVIPSCIRRDICQADESTTHYQTVLGKKSRILITANGTKVPITASFGLVPFFRVQIFDLETGAEVYREEDLLRPRQRSALLSPDGDILVVSDGETASIHKLPE